MTNEESSIQKTRIDVLVVGAGPAGVTAAAEARRHGLSVRIIDKNDARTPYSKALVVHSRTLELFSDMGVVSRVLGRGREFRGLNIYIDQKPISRIVFHELDWQDACYPFWLSIPQSDTELCLTEHLSEHGVEIERQTELTGFTQHTDFVSAELRRADGRAETCEATWVVGCDGARSDVRRLLGIDFQGTADDEVFILADVTLESALADAEGHNFMSPGGIAIVVPMCKPGEARLIFHMPELHVTDKPDITLSMLQSLLDERTGQQTRIVEVGWTSHFSVKHFVAKHHRQGRIFLAGDAAHIHSPVGGQGLNTGIQDAYNLMWKLALFHKGHASAELLDSYEAERHAVAEDTIKTVRRATTMMTLRHTVSQGLRNQLAEVLMSTDMVKNRMGHSVGMLNLDYENSPIVAEDLPATGFLSQIARRVMPGARYDFSDGPDAGDLAPSVEVAGADGASIRLLDVMRGPQHTLLLFVGADGSGQTDAWLAAIADLRQRYHATIVPVVIERDTTAIRSRAADFDGMVVCDSDEKAHRRYGAHAPCLYLVRPDKYIAYRCQPVDFERLRAYLDRVLVIKTT